MSITKDDLNHVLKLSHLYIPEEDKDHYLEDMQHTFDLMKSMDELDLSNTDPTAYAISQEQYLRDDKVLEKQDYFLEKNAPQWENGCFRVPQILGEAD